MCEGVLSNVPLSITYRCPTAPLMTATTKENGYLLSVQLIFVCFLLFSCFAVLFIISWNEERDKFDILQHLTTQHINKQTRMMFATTQFGNIIRAQNTSMYELYVWMNVCYQMLTSVVHSFAGVLLLSCSSPQYVDWEINSQFWKQIIEICKQFHSQWREIGNKSSKKISLNWIS